MSVIKLLLSFNPTGLYLQRKLQVQSKRLAQSYTVILNQLAPCLGLRLASDMSREKFHLKHRWKSKALQSWKRYIQHHEFSESVTETMTETHGTVSSPVLIRGIHHYDDIQDEVGSDGFNCTFDGGFAQDAGPFDSGGLRKK
ncbi:hypothetical protein YC2023_023399 [Brassica napus]